VQWLPQQEEEEEMEVSVEEYMPPGISEEEAIKVDIEDFEFFELSQCEGRLAAARLDSR
jgi:hypothetical protein